MAATKKVVLFFSLIFLSAHLFAAILPEEQADILYHSYDGGGVTIDGPSVLVRKNTGEKFSFSTNYYVDMVSSASVDVLATASAYEEERTEYSFGTDYLNDRTIMGVSYTKSKENDYIAETVGFNISQEFFGDLTTLTMGYSMGDDTVMATGAEDFSASAKRRRYSVGVSQILTRKLITSFSYESVIDEGFLRNPYRRVRRVDHLDEVSGEEALFISATENEARCETEGSEVGGECYPETRNSEAIALRGIYSLTPTTSARVEYRQFEDSWDIKSSNWEMRLAHQYSPSWLFEFRARAYEQEGAFFYSDLFDFSSSVPDYYARDKELSDYSSQQYGLGITYIFKSHIGFFNDSKLSFFWDRMIFDYENFRDVTTEGTYAAGEEPLYSLEADVFRIFFSAYF